MESLTARLPNGARPDRVRFEVGDALRLRPGLGTFDWVLAANLIDRVPDPAGLLAGFESLVNPGGQLVLTSPYTWLEDYTPRSGWLTKDGRRTTEILAAHLRGFGFFAANRPAVCAAGARPEVSMERG
jgi:SAM-dependent methyltransferase